MLSFFRSGGVGQVLVAGVAFAIIVVFALEFRAGGSGPTGKLELECAVKYDGYCVDSKEYFAAHGMIVPNGVEPKRAKALGLRKMVLEGLLERELLVAEAKRLGLEVSEEALDQDLSAGRVRASLPAKQLGRDPERPFEPEISYMLGLCAAPDAGYGCAPGSEYPVRQLQVQRTKGEPFDYKLYEKQVRMMTNRGPKEFKEMQDRELLAARMRDLVRSRVRIPEPEAFQLFERDRTRAVVRSVDLRRDWFAKYAVVVDDDAVNKWALAHQQQVDGEWSGKKADFPAGCALASEIFVPLPPNALDDEKAPIKQKAEHARERVAKGESFAAVARELSQGPAAISGGDLGCLGKSYGVGADELLKAAESLKPGELSPVVESPRGFHVLRISGKLAEGKSEEIGRKYLARRLYARFAADEALASFGAQLASRAKAGEKLEDATRELSVRFAAAAAKPGEKSKAADSADVPALLAADRPKFEVSAPFNASGNPLPDVEPTEPLAVKALELKQPDEVFGTPIATATGAVVIQLKERTAASREEFVKEKANLVRALLQAKAREALIRYVQDLRRAAGDKLIVLAQYGEESKSTQSEE